MFNFTEWFHKDICPVEVGVNFGNFDISVLDMIFEAMSY